MPSTNSMHQAKRPYAGSHSQSQLPITSYFHPHPLNFDSRISQTESRAFPETNSSLSPPLPALVQSNLLSVGMRVRKSVCEGYKTGSNPGLYELALFSDAQIMTPAAVPPAQYEAYGEYNATKELAPFCGIMKVGGFGVQSQSSWGNEVPYEDTEEQVLPLEEDVPFLSSQGSTISSSSEESVSRQTRLGYKRRYSDGEHVEGDREREPFHQGGGSMIWLDDQELEIQLSPKTRPADLPGTRAGGLGSRPLAMPKSRRKRAGAKRLCEAAEGQENIMDFEEAEFLDYAFGDRGGEEAIMSDAQREIVMDYS